MQGEIQALAAGEDRLQDQLEDNDVQAGRVKEIRAQKYVGAARKGDVEGCGASLKMRLEIEVGRCGMLSSERESKYSCFIGFSKAVKKLYSNLDKRREKNEARASSS